MSTTIHYDFEVCNKCAEHLSSFGDKWEASRPKFPEAQGFGTFMDELREIAEVFNMLHTSFEELAMESGKYIGQVAAQMRAIDEAAKEAFVSE